MDHDEAMRLQAAEKYLLRELPPAQVEEYEEHYFDCPACTEELKTTVAFMESSRQVFREEARQADGNKRLTLDASGWLAWLRPAFVIPVFAALLLVIGYQNGVTIPGLKQVPSRAVTAEVVKSFSLLTAGARSDSSSSTTLRVSPREDFGLDLDMPGNSSTGYTCQIIDVSGKIRFTLPISADAAKSSVHVNIPGGSLQPGKYNFAIFTGQSSAVQTDLGNAAAKLPFTVEFQP